MGTNTIQPYDPLQAALLAALYTSPSTWEQAAEIAPSFMFTGEYKPLAHSLYSYLEQTGGQFAYADFALHANGEGVTDACLASPLDFIATGEALEYAEAVKEQFLKRSALAAIDMAKARMSQGQAPSEVIGTLRNDIDILGEQAPAEKETRMAQIQQARELLYRVDKYPSTGFEQFDNIVGGWVPGHLVVIAARAGMGKTTIMLDLAKAYNVTDDKPVAVFSLEMSAVTLYTKLACKAAKVNSYDLVQRYLTEEDLRRVDQGLQKLYDSRVKVFSMPETSGTLLDVVSKIKSLNKTAGVQLFFIDYIQLVNGEATKGEIREQTIARISRTLKLTALKFGLTIVAFSQLSRAVETRVGSKRPQLSDIRESGAIEQDADIITFLYRPEYYGILEDEEGNSLRGKLEVIVSKNRDAGVTRSFMLTFQAGDTYLESPGTQYPTGMVPNKDEEDLPF